MYHVGTWHRRKEWEAMGLEAHEEGYYSPDCLHMHTIEVRNELRPAALERMLHLESEKMLRLRKNRIPYCSMAFNSYFRPLKK